MPQDDNEATPVNRIDRPQDSFVGKLRPDPVQPPTPTVAMQGFLGDSDRPGFRRLYFSRALDHYAEFREGDVVDAAPIEADQAPFVGDEATRVLLRDDASVDYTHTRKATPVDEFDIDIRFGGRTASDRSGLVAHTNCDAADCPYTHQGTCTCYTQCGQDTCHTCHTACQQWTCETCYSNCETCPAWPCPPAPTEHGYGPSCPDYLCIPKISDACPQRR